MDGSDRIWRICNFMTQTQPNPTRYKKKFVTQPNPQSFKNQPNPVGRVVLGRFGKSVGFLHTPN